MHAGTERLWRPVDIVCHSMGTCIARYLLRSSTAGPRGGCPVPCGIGPPNRGSAMPRLNDPEQGPEVIRRLAGVFVPRGYDPAEDLIVQEFRPGSRVTSALSRAGTRDDIAYRLILAANLTRTPAFFPAFGGRTLEFAPGEGWRMTYAGDGIVPHSDSHLPGAGGIPRRPCQPGPHPERYAHHAATKPRSRTPGCLAPLQRLTCGLARVDRTLGSLAFFAAWMFVAFRRPE